MVELEKERCEADNGDAGGGLILRYSAANYLGAMYMAGWPPLSPEWVLWR